MATAPRTRPRPRPSVGHNRTTFATPAPTPSAVDQRRYYDFRSGISAEELATRENVRLATIEKSIQAMLAYQSRFSQDAAEVATRQLYLEVLPHAGVALVDAMAATRTNTRKSQKLVMDDRTGEPRWVDEEIVEHEPDHKTRLEATRALQGLMAAVQPKTPMVQVDARQQHLHAPGAGQGSPLGLPSHTSGALSVESILRAVRSEQGLDNGSGVKQLGNGDQPLPSADRDFELEAEMAEDEDDEGGEDLDGSAAPAAEFAPES